MATVHELLRCLKCNNDVVFTHPAVQFAQVDTELTCVSCGQAYPVYQGIPIMFSDAARTEVLLNEPLQKSLVSEAHVLSQMTATVDKRSLPTKHDKLTAALAWELLFFSKWKENDDGFVNYDADKIENILNNDPVGQLKRKMLDDILSREQSLNGKVLLNIGAGRDFLLNMFLNKGATVIEQDIVLESLLCLKERGASFCICSDARELPFKAKAVDITLCIRSLHHMWPIIKPVGEFLRTTKGGVYIQEPNAFSALRIWRGGLARITRPFRRKATSAKSSSSPFEKSISYFQFAQSVKDNGGNIEKFKYYRDSGGAGFPFSAAVKLFPFLSANFSAVISPQ